MSSESRFTTQNKTTQERISSQTVGLVALSDFRKRRAEVLEQQVREAREAAIAGSPTPTSTSTPDRSLTSTPDNAADRAAPPRKKKAKTKLKTTGAKLSFGDDDDEQGNEGEDGKDKEVTPQDTGADKFKSKVKINASVAVVPRPVTKSALRREAAEREALRREFLARQERVKATEIAIPFVFYDGSNLPGGMVRVKKGDFVWQFLDKSRKAGANLAVGARERANARREWARVGVDDLLMVRGNVIIPHHYDFLFFIMNKTLGPNGIILFNYDTEAAPRESPEETVHQGNQASPPTSLSAQTAQTPIESLEGASDNPVLTKVVDRRWYERNKHIYPASTWQDFDPEKDYQSEIRRDPGGNTFFYT
ncbi:XAP5-domain-containing protein [Xylariaceae sp. FL0594]|nr:XAP5-domain-containing protein [Xylariaceae sp. FL0594]